MNDVDNQHPIKVTTAHGPEIRDRTRKKGLASNMLELILRRFHKEPIEMLFIAFLEAENETMPPLAAHSHSFEPGCPQVWDKKPYC